MANLLELLILSVCDTVQEMGLRKRFWYFSNVRTGRIANV